MTSKEELIEAAKAFYGRWMSDKTNDGRTWGTADVLAVFAKEQLDAQAARYEAAIAAAERAGISASRPSDDDDGDGDIDLWNNAVEQTTYFVIKKIREKLSDG